MARRDAPVRFQEQPGHSYQRLLPPRLSRLAVWSTLSYFVLCITLMLLGATASTRWWSMFFVVPVVGRSDMLGLLAFFAPLLLLCAVSLLSAVIALFARCLRSRRVTTCCWPWGPHGGISSSALPFGRR